MYKHFIICNIFFIFTIQGKMIPSVNPTTKTFPAVITTLTEKVENSSNKVTSEGAITHNTTVVTLPNNDMALINLEKNVSVTKETSVVARKGVNYDDGIKSHEDKFNNKNPLSTVTKAANNSTTILNDTIILGKPKLSNDEKIANGTKIHKPLLVSSEALAKMDKINNVNIDENITSIRAHIVKAGSHPGMILPIVITILVVPMFAIIGYMALKRGQEAWKNRHYKRMDFLLDGMYND